VMIYLGIKYPKMNAEGTQAPAGGPTSTPATTVPANAVAPVEGAAKVPTQGPNDAWEADAKLDANGNPLAEDTGAPKEASKSAEGEKPKPTQAEAAERYAKVATKEVGAQITTVLTEAGVDATDAANTIRENGGKVTPAIAKALVEKHGETVAGIVINQMEAVSQAGIATAEANDNAVYDQVADAFKGVTEQSGKDTWKELAGWAKANVPEGDREQINTMLQAGGLQAKLAVQSLVESFKNSDNFTQSPVLEQGDNTTTERGVQPLSKADYQREFRALEAKGHVYGQSQEMAQLDKRRTAGIKLGR
jgi:hypothetical protein